MSRACIVVIGLLLIGLASLLPGSIGWTQESPGTPVAVEGGGSYTDVTSSGLAAMLQAKDFPLINVHIPYEGELEGTDLFLPFNEIEANLHQLPADPGARIVLYCRSGSMSAIAARALVSRGYTDVWNLDGGMVGWEKSGYSLVHLGR